MPTRKTLPRSAAVALSTLLLLLLLCLPRANAAKTQVLHEKYRDLCKGQPALQKKHESTLRNLVREVGHASLVLSTSPQHEAACWILRENRGWKPQRFALAVIYYATKGINWEHNTDWMTRRHECSWYGVKCNTLKTVVGLDLGYIEVNGLLPRELGMLSALTDLDLHGNDLQGVIPQKVVVGLKSLQYLRMHMNSMFGAIPKEIASMKNLRELHMFGNYMSSTIPKELGKLKKLQVIDLYANMLEGRIPKELADIPNLKVLDLHDNNLTGTMPKEICAKKLDVLAADCYGPNPEIRCDCCTVCCQGLPAMICVDAKTGKRVDNVYGEVEQPITPKKAKKSK